MRLKDVGKTYGDRTVLSHIDLEFEEGKITAVLGESGAGKTTLLNILSGMTSHDGTVEGRGTSSYLFQQAKLLPHLTVEQNLAFVLKKEDRGKISPMLERVGLRGKETRLPGTLSGGECQRVAIARAFLFPHDVLLMDEPFSSLDLALKRSLIELVVSLWKERHETIVFVTHDVHEAALLSHRAIVLKGGRMLGNFPVDGDLPRNFFEAHPVERSLVAALTEGIGESDEGADRAR